MISRRLVLGSALAIPAAAVIPGPAEADVNVVSEGWRMGLLSKYSSRGLLNKTGEGELLLGNESSPLVRTVGSGTDARQVQDNPWLFSSDLPTYNRFRPLLGKYVAIRYRQYHLTGPLSGDTDYRVEEIVEVDQALTPAAFGAAGHGARSDGSRIGRLVKATSKGTVSKSFEVQIQVGNAGNQFLDMSILQEPMYEAAIQFLRSGRRVKITYNQSTFYNPLARNTNYEVVAIELNAGSLIN